VAWTKTLTATVGTTHVYGVEIVEERIKEAESKGIIVKKFDLNHDFLFPNGFFDVVHSNQVIEHLNDVDHFVEEIFRILKPHAYAIISTENLSSWDNLFALALGQQAFSQSISQRRFLGNKMSPNYKQKIDTPYFAHRTIFTYYGLQELFQNYGFYVEQIVSAGYLPRTLDPVHARYITIKARKP
jgi:SAM-dependent methyltransferase